MMNRIITFFIINLVFILTPLFAENTENWPRLRGSQANGLPADISNQSLPVKWSKTENVKWKTNVPGSGWSSPIVWGDKVFVTSVINDKAEENEKPKAGLYLGRGRRGIPSGLHHWMVYCMDLKTGKLLWKNEAHTGEPPVGRHPKSTYAAETPVTDGKRLYVLFGDVGMWCYDLNGKEIWKHKIEPKKTMFDYGAAASPVIHEDQVIYVYDNNEQSYIAALDVEKGTEKWRVLRDGRSTWATPYIWKTKDRTEIVVPGRKKILSYDLDGKMLWELSGRMSNLVIPSPFVVDDLLYVTSGYFADPHRPVYVIKPGAKGDISLKEEEESNNFIKWYQPKAGPYNTTPVVYNGIYYLLLDQGMISTYDSKTGKQFYDRIRFPRGASFTSSPWGYKDKLFCLAENGKTYVLKAGKEFEILHVNDLDELCMTCPAIVGGQLLIRTESAVYCISDSKK
ncbi:MAG: serine/threonine protein kinase [Rickettsiales bacterium]|nr:serine/threonine protein kinase [Rickettsiales bacterium]